MLPRIKDNTFTYSISRYHPDTPSYGLRTLRKYTGKTTIGTNLVGKVNPTATGVGHYVLAANIHSSSGIYAQYTQLLGWRSFESRYAQGIVQ